MIEADLWVLPQSAIPGVVAAASPRKSLFGSREDQFYKILRAQGTSIAYFEWWGYATLMCLQYLHDNKSVDLLKFMETPTAGAIQDARGTLCLTIDGAEALALRSMLTNIELNPAALCDFYNDFNEEDNTEAGNAMLAALEAVQRLLEQIQHGTVGLILVG